MALATVSPDGANRPASNFCGIMRLVLVGISALLLVGISALLLVVSILLAEALSKEGN